MSEFIFHIAEAEHWDEALASGEYVWSTLGRTIEDEGFMHASEPHQWRATLERFYADHDGLLVLLMIDPARLTAPLVREVGNPVTGEEFPHLYGPLPVAAVVATRSGTREELLHDRAKSRALIEGARKQ